MIKTKLNAYCDYWLDIVVSISIMMLVGSIALYTVFLITKSALFPIKNIPICETHLAEKVCVQCITAQYNAP